MPRSSRTQGPGRRFPVPDGREVSLETRDGGRKVTPPSRDAEKKASNRSRADRPSVAYQKTPRAPPGLAAIIGWNCDASAGASRTTGFGLLHEAPRSVENERRRRDRSPSSSVDTA